MALNIRLKFFQYAILVSAALLPWNATAVNTERLVSKTFTHQLGRDLVERLLVKSLMEVAQGNTKQAMQTVNELIRKVPNFKLAYLIRGDLLSAQTRPLENFGNPDSKYSSAEVEGLRQEARTRINHYFSEDDSRLTPNIPIQMGEKQQHLILIDTVKSRLFLYKKSNSGLQHVSDYYVSIGKNGADKYVEGDKRTPVGVYFSAKKLTTPLSDFYGDGAYPLNYPNELDKHKNKSGSGIWLHGTPKDTYSRPPRASDGCIVLSNPDLNKLKPFLKSGNVPVIISDNVQWLNTTKTKLKNSQLKALNNAIETWRSDWVSQNTKRYLSHYSNGFFYSGGKLKQWTDHKRRVQSGKPKVTIKVNDISIYGYPTKTSQTTSKTKSTTPIVVVNFEQFYQSPTLKNTMRKRQYWKHENKQWKIIYEGAA